MKNEEKTVCFSWIDSIFWNKSNIFLMHRILGKKENGKERKKFNLELLGTCAT